MHRAEICRDGGPLTRLLQVNFQTILLWSSPQDVLNLKATWPVICQATTSVASGKVDRPNAQSTVGPTFQPDAQPTTWLAKRQNAIRWKDLVVFVWCFSKKDSKGSLYGAHRKSVGTQWMDSMGRLKEWMQSMDSTGRRNEWMHCVQSIRILKNYGFCKDTMTRWITLT